MTDSFSFTIPTIGPSINKSYKIVTMRSGQNKTSRLAKTAEAVAWQMGVTYLVKTSRPSGWTPGRRVRIEMRFFMNRLGRDADNIQKNLLDGIAKGLGVNDNTFLPCVLSNEVDRTNPRIEVTVSNVDDA